jgi:hypothetical protein
MPQDRQSGDSARRWGYENAEKVAVHLGASLVSPGRSNEAVWNNRRILIVSAHHGTPNIYVTIATLDRIEAILACLQDKDSKFTLYEITPSWFQQNMRQSRSSGGSHIMGVKCADVRRVGQIIGRM